MGTCAGVSLHGANNDRIRKIHEVVAQLRGPTIVSKGPLDVICDTKSVIVCTTTAGGC